MRRIGYASWLVLLLGVALTGCGTRHQGGGSPGAKEYPLKGKVITVDRAQRAVQLDHEDIPGLMKAMRMEFHTTDSQMLEGIEPGDRVEGRLQVEGSHYVITQLKKGV